MCRKIHAPTWNQADLHSVKQSGCILMTAGYEILLPGEQMILATIQHSTAKKFDDDPVATLSKLGQPECGSDSTTR